MNYDRLSNLSTKNIPVIEAKLFNNNSNKFSDYLAIGLTILIIFFREAIGGVPYFDFMRIIKYPVAVLTILLTFPALIRGWQTASRGQRRFVAICLLIGLAGTISTLLNPEFASLTALMRLFELAILALLIVLLISSPEKPKLFFYGYIIIGLVSILLGAFYNIGAMDIDNITSDEYRFEGIGFDPNYFCMLIMIPLAYCYVQGSDKNKSISFRLFYNLLSVIFLIAILWSRSRAGMVAGLIVILVASYFRGFKTTMVNSLLLFMAILVMLFVIKPQTMSGMSRGALERWQIGNLQQSRAALWVATSQNIVKKPLLGWGPGSIPVMLHKEKFKTIYQQVPHNAWISLTIERGLVGLFFAVWLIIMGIKSSWSLCKRNELPIRSLGIAIITGLIGQLLMSGTLAGMPYGLFVISGIATAVNGQLNSTNIINDCSLNQ